MPDTANKSFWEKIATEKTGIFLTCAGLAIIIGAIIAFVFFSQWSFSRTIDEAIFGQFGDFIGGVVGTLFALAGVVLYYVALTEQRKDLKINQDNLKIQTEALKQQIEEFKAQKEEMAETRRVYEQQTELFQEQTNLYREQSIAMKNQASEAKKQTAIYLEEQFDASFYPLLNLICEAQKDNDNAIRDINSAIQSKIEKDDNINKTYKKILEEYREQYQKHGEAMGRMFDMIAQMVRLIHNTSAFDEGRKRHYISILQAQLSGRTKVVLFYHIFSETGKNEKPLYLQSGFFDKLTFMQRCEFVALYPSNLYLSLGMFAGEITPFICNSLHYATSLEEWTGSTDEEIELMGVKVQSQLSQDGDGLHYNLNVQQADWKKTGLDKNDFRQFMSFLIYEVRYISSFKMPVAETVNSKMEEKDGIISFGYEIVID